MLLGNKSTNSDNFNKISGVSKVFAPISDFIETVITSGLSKIAPAFTPKP